MRAGVDGKWVLLMVDNHASRFDDEMWAFAAEHNILLFALPSSSTAKMQPLDVGPNVRFKEALFDCYDNECCDWKANPLSKRDIVGRVLYPAWNVGFSKEAIQIGWRDSGFYPFDRKRVKPIELVATTRAQAGEETKTLAIPDDLAEVLILPSDSELASFHQQLAPKRKGKTKYRARLLTTKGEQQAAQEYREEQQKKAAEKEAKRERQKERKRKREESAKQKEAKKRAREEKKREQKQNREVKARLRAEMKERKQGNKAAKAVRAERERVRSGRRRRWRLIDSDNEADDGEPGRSWEDLEADALGAVNANTDKDQKETNEAKNESDSKEQIKPSRKRKRGRPRSARSPKRRALSEACAFDINNVFSGESV